MWYISSYDLLQSLQSYGPLDRYACCRVIFGKHSQFVRVVNYKYTPPGTESRHYYFILQWPLCTIPLHMKSVTHINIQHLIFFFRMSTWRRSNRHCLRTDFWLSELIFWNQRSRRRRLSKLTLKNPNHEMVKPTCNICIYAYSLHKCISIFPLCIKYYA